MAFSSWSGLAPAPCSPGSSCSCLSLVRATSSWWVQSLVATIPSRPTLWAAVARSWRVTSSEHLWRPGYQSRAELNSRESGARGPHVAHMWPTCQAMDQAWGLDAVAEQDLLVPRLANLFLPHLDPRHGAMAPDCDQGRAPFPVSVLRLELLPS